ncbi:hypothetical protein EKH57_11325 [Halorubrum sp. BOL3-1]|uniref:OapC/ArvC family zinc-ribbon domain-containing protein n=1 Tax=Halorubrum sp. BOL3-1 TaxID=2497325 RepID=UPI001004F953|nr:Zn-ribbon containing protein [Halorubrum sp. BOL3-1]QAU13268.1 hypothetical protein EKH57_11325 [Halorubrum sp. BOL3-1]
MPHQCTTCGRTFSDGSKEMLSGCPDCGGNKFQFKPAGATEDPAAGDDDGSAGAAAGPSPPAPEDRSTPTPEEDTSDPTPSDPPDPTPSDPTDPTPSDATSTDPSAESDGTEQIGDRSDEDTAQASARSEVVSPDELDRASHEVDAAETPPADEEQPGIDALRDELNDQFESIRIVSPGQYELNLMELYDRQEYIISLQEDGRYVIEMPDAWGIQDE